MKVLVTSAAYGQPAMKENIKYLESFAEVVMKAQPEPLTKEEIQKYWEGCDGIIAGLEWYTQEMFTKAPKSLKVISRYGVGCEHVDISAANRAGIAVTNTPGANAKAVAELAVTHMLVLGRQIITMDSNTRAGKWIRPMGNGLDGRMLGLIGYGAIGKQVARMVKGFGMGVMIYDPYADTGTAQKEGVETADNLDELYRHSDIISLHVPETEKTRHMINRESIHKMKEGVCIINAARGGLIDMEALEEASYQAG
ncbi:NAD(P)-dependent oxidoreductase [Clostridium sp. AM58-1XD]|uniref:NAD(P)-dependent oxidoreductase n=1 Tax=Clostridium sp. AM58-1XD TaxID=2292307 RepID=UPI000E54CB0B|nr:NAD(P)-dependent oxidoreductase [Clostridium sp. AM58-1XD]RGZ01153.1 phosphoglycerate dehydrogenase [Clostridium sp. AM58-1XD]